MQTIFKYTQKYIIKDLDETITRMNADIKEITKWTIKDRLKLNPKAKSIIMFAQSRLFNTIY